MKTAMQELIDDIKRVIPAFKLEIYEQNFNAYIEKEKEQILKAHVNGQSEFDMLKYRDVNRILSENYYNKNYNL